MISKSGKIETRRTHRQTTLSLVRHQTVTVNPVSDPTIRRTAKVVFPRLAMRNSFYITPISTPMHTRLIIGMFPLLFE
jgi:hypothetical protein